MNTNARWFDVESGFLSAGPREFLTALRSLAPQWSAFGLTADDSFADARYADLSVALDICERAERAVIRAFRHNGDGLICDNKRAADVVIRSLRVDFDMGIVLCGAGEPHQILEPLDATAPDVKAYGDASVTPLRCAEFAADWISSKLARVIERREWHTALFRHRQYVLTDVERCLVWSDSRNTKRDNLGQPDEVRVVHPPLKARNM